MRGCDTDGHVANFVETEQIVSSADKLSSFVQIRYDAPVKEGEDCLDCNGVVSPEEACDGPEEDEKLSKCVSCAFLMVLSHSFFPSLYLCVRGNRGSVPLLWHQNSIQRGSLSYNPKPRFDGDFDSNVRPVCKILYITLVWWVV